MNVTPAELAAILRREGYAVNQFGNVVEIADGNVSDAQPGALSSARTRHASEHDEQVALFAWADLAEAEHPELAMLFAVPNGGQRHPAVAAKLKAEGTKAGVPDILLDVARGRFHGLRIELKRADHSNGPTPEQNEWIAHYHYYGYSAVVCYGAQDAIGVIQAYLSQDGAR